MASTKHAEKIQDEKKRIRRQISEIQTQINALNKVPSRVLNGSHTIAVGWKDALCSLRNSRFATTPPGKNCSLRRLIDIKAKLADSFSLVEK